MDKIVTYYLKTLNEEARKVLHHYASKGIVDLYFHELANEGKPALLRNTHARYLTKV